MYLGKLDIIKEEVWFSQKTQFHTNYRTLLKYQMHTYSLNFQMGNLILLAEAYIHILLAEAHIDCNDIYIIIIYIYHYNSQPCMFQK